MGYASATKPRRPDHDALLAKLIEQRNAARKERNRAKAENRTMVQEELKVLQRKVRKRLEVVKARSGTR